jgi:hypothetical protein
MRTSIRRFEASGEGCCVLADPDYLGRHFQESSMQAYGTSLDVKGNLANI